MLAGQWIGIRSIPTYSGVATIIMRACAVLMKEIKPIAVLVKETKPIAALTQRPC